MKRKSGKKLFTTNIYNFVLPILFFEALYLLYALLAIVLIEAYIISKRFKLPLPKTYKYLFLVNVISTLVGLLFQGILRLLIGYSAFFIFGESKIMNVLAGNIDWDNSNFNIESILEIIIALTLTCLVSIYIEYKCLKGVLGDRFSNNEIRKSVKIANFVSYVLLLIYMIICVTIKSRT